MWRWRIVFQKIRTSLWRKRAESEMNHEIDAHLALIEDEFRRRGMAVDQARLAARRAFGGVEGTKEMHRQERCFLWLEHALQDLRYAVRVCRHNAGFTSVVVITLALGISATTLIFSILSGILLRPLA